MDAPPRAREPRTDKPHVVIIGGGFAGLAAALSLANAPVRVTLIDRRNHHLFQPLLYQVATASLSPAQIAAPIRRILKHQRNTEVLLAEAARIDVNARRVILTDGEIDYDYLILAAGATHSYFGHDSWAPHAPGLKTIEDATEIRRRFLLAFERAERERDAEKRRAELTFVVVGAGPTGVELAGAMIEIARRSIPGDFRAIDTTSARVVLVEAQDRVLSGGFPQALSEKARLDLAELGVEVCLRSRVTAIDADGVTIESLGSPSATERIRATNVIWAAGVLASPLGASLGAPIDRSGRVIVESDLSIPSHPEVFVTGDLAHVKHEKYGQVPGMCPAAVQMGKHAARLILAQVCGRAPATRAPFVYSDKGLLATIGRARAVAALPSAGFSGFPAWLLWAMVHIFFLISFRAKVLVMIEWAWAYFVFERGARLITGEGAAASAGAARRA